MTRLAPLHWSIFWALSPGQSLKNLSVISLFIYSARWPTTPHRVHDFSYTSLHSKYHHTTRPNPLCMQNKNGKLICIASFSSYSSLQFSTERITILAPKHIASRLANKQAVKPALTTWDTLHVSTDRKTRLAWLHVPKSSLCGLDNLFVSKSAWHWSPGIFILSNICTI
jgi:hypothetical protein